MEWWRESWGYVLLGGGFLGAVIIAIRNTYAAERDRQALRQSSLEREKLVLEIARLRNSPEIVHERRAIYDKLREVLGEVMRSAVVELPHIGSLHQVAHDSEYRFPPEIVAPIRSLITAAVGLHVSGEFMKRGANRMNDGEWRKLVEDNHNALMELVAFQQGMIELFRPHLSL